VKNIKRLITGNVGRDGSLNVDKFQQAILQYHNTPDKDTKLSPAMCIIGRPIKDSNSTGQAPTTSSVERIFVGQRRDFEEASPGQSRALAGAYDQIELSLTL